jgi:hypothetical protein
MSTFAVVSRESERSLWAGLPEFEVALMQTFPDVRITARDTDAVEAIAWTRGDYGSPSWMDGSINAEVTAVFLRGDDRLIYETALWLQSAVGDGVLTWDWQGIPFALARIASVEALAAAVERNDESLDYRHRVTLGDAD